MRFTLRGFLRLLATTSILIITTIISLGAILSSSDGDLLSAKVQTINIAVSGAVEQLNPNGTTVPAHQQRSLLHFKTQQIELAAWLDRFGFNWQNQLLLSSADLIENSPAIIPAALFSILLNCIFMVLVAGPIVLMGVFILLGNPFNLWTLTKTGRDILGSCGNGRVFFSGARARIPRELCRSDYSAPIPALISAPRVNPPTFWFSKLNEELERCGCLNKTTMELGRIILAGANLPAFIVGEDEEEIFNRRMESVSVEEYTLLGLRSITKAFERFDSPEARVKEQDSPFRIQSAEHMALLSYSMVRVLDLDSVQALKRDRGQLLTVTLVLARIAGLVHCTERYAETRFLCSSMYPELSGRALLQALPSFVREYSSLEQSDIRRALSLTTRVSPVGTAKVPIGISHRCFALRQWSELIGENPIRLTYLADDLELYALLNQAKLRFEKALLGKIRARDRELFNAAVVTGSRNLLVRVQALTQMFREVFEDATIRRIEELSTVVNLKRRIKAKQSVQERHDSDLGFDSNSNVTLPLSLSEVRQIAKDHGIEPRDLKDWSILKGILGMHGWLARRVGDVPVPRTAVVFLISGDAGDREFDEGFVALRDDRLQESFGELWADRFRIDSTVTIVSSRDRVERALVDEDQLGFDLFTQDDDVGEGI